MGMSHDFEVAIEEGATIVRVGHGDLRPARRRRRPERDVDAEPRRRGVRIDVRVIPRARRAGIDGVRDGRLVVRVTAPPVDGAANDAIDRGARRRARSCRDARFASSRAPRRATRRSKSTVAGRRDDCGPASDAAAPVTVPTLAHRTSRAALSGRRSRAARRRAAGRSSRRFATARSPVPASAFSRRARPPTCARPSPLGPAHARHRRPRQVARPRLRRRPHARRLCRRSARRAAASPGRRDVRGDRRGRRRHPVDGARHPRGARGRSWRPRRAAGSRRCSRRARRRARRRAATGSRRRPELRMLRVIAAARRASSRSSSSRRSWARTKCRPSIAAVRPTSCGSSSTR